MTLDKKQKVVLVLTILAFAFLAWQIYDLFFKGPDVVAPQPVVVKKVSPKKPSQPKLVKTAPKKAAGNNQADKDDVPVTERKQYLSMVEQLELYKVQGQVLAQQLQIARARQAIAKINSETDSNTQPSVAVAVSDQAPLRLSYIAKQHGQWQAMIDNNGQYQTAIKGQRLLNGMLVRSINADQVVLAKGKKAYRLSFSGLVSS